MQIFYTTAVRFSIDVSLLPTKPDFIVISTRFTIHRHDGLVSALFIR